MGSSPGLGGLQLDSGRRDVEVADICASGASVAASFVSECVFWNTVDFCFKVCPSNGGFQALTKLSSASHNFSNTNDSLLNCFYNTRHVFRETICNCRANCAFALLSQMFPRMKQSVVADKCSRCHAKSAQMVYEDGRVNENLGKFQWQLLTKQWHNCRDP